MTPEHIKCRNERDALRAEIERMKGPLHTPERYDEIEELKARLNEALELLRRAVDDGGDNRWIQEVRQFLREQKQ